MEDKSAPQVPQEHQIEGVGNLVQNQLTIPFPETYIYSNVSAYSTSMMDVHISFAEALPDRTVAARVGIVMTPEHAAHVALSLLQQLMYFEKRFGEIREPEWRAHQKRADEDSPPNAATVGEQQPAEK